MPVALCHRKVTRKPLAMTGVGTGETLQLPARAVKLGGRRGGPVRYVGGGIGPEGDDLRKLNLYVAWEIKADVFHGEWAEAHRLGARERARFVKFPHLLRATGRRRKPR
jgi:hypothetical protein